MDSQDREFEALLKRFQLRSPASFPAEIQAARREPARLWWAIPVVAAVVAIAIGIFWFSSVLGSFVTVEIAGDSSYKAGERVALRTPIESGARETFVWSLGDGSRVEMRAQSSVSVESDGLRLISGSVLVSTAKVKSGDFHVVTRDGRVVMTGTVFVEALPVGTRVGVIEGEAEVRSGAVAKKLHQGEQLATNIDTTLSPLPEAIAWSRRATELAALLPAPAPAAPIVAFTPAPPPRLTRTEVIPPVQPVQEAAQPAAQQTQPQPVWRPLTPAEETEYRNLLSKEQRQSAAGAESPGSQIVARECGQCHRPDIAPSQPFANQEAVQTLVERQMAMGARVSQAELPSLVDYLFRTYGVRPLQPPRPQPAPEPKPEPPPGPAAPAPAPGGAPKPADTGPRIVAAMCTSCHDAEIATSLRADNREAYEAMVSRMISIGAPLGSTNLPETQLLIEYLFRTYGTRRAR